eukprot:CAMPEP_0167740858 /NCGR_PEP_ID=MMETSP0110_2-20121227/527_1 /TAXON_ID=629695 /ORGANISM="Gymnochlora sp., Strain CCMP2014" /LENGTH=500 /DNA_ID=CAMNT_0007624831 /DNA_START=135 /DNA_END=1634 /DNA_ORIENTATION=-
MASLHRSNRKRQLQQHQQTSSPIQTSASQSQNTSQQWPYPLVQNQYPAYQYPTSLHLSNAAQASMLTTPMASYNESGRSVDSSGRAAVTQVKREPKLRNPGAVASSSVQQGKAAASKRASGRRQETIVEVPPDQMKELLAIREIKQRRLARKAELARLSRRRTKDMLHSVQEEIINLEKELAQIRKQSVRPCARCDKRLKFPEIQGVDGKLSFEGMRIKLPNYTDSLETKNFLDSSTERARSFIHKSMISSLDALARERKKRRALDSGTSGSLSEGVASSSVSRNIDSPAMQAIGPHHMVPALGTPPSRQGNFDVERQPGNQLGFTEQNVRSHKKKSEEGDSKQSGQDNEGHISEELEKFLVENLMTHYKRRQLTAQFHLASIQQHASLCKTINTMMALVLNFDIVSKIKDKETWDLVSRLQFSSQQIERMANMKTSIIEQFTFTGDLHKIQGFLIQELLGLHSNDRTNNPEKSTGISVSKLPAPPRSPLTNKINYDRVW